MDVLFCIFSCLTVERPKSADALMDVVVEVKPIPLALSDL